MFTVFTDQEISRIMEQARQYGHRTDGKWEALIGVLANYGPRVSEVLALRWNQVDFARNTITLPTFKRRKPMSRTLPLLPAVAETLRKYRAFVNGDPRVFPMKTWGRCVIWRAFQRMCERSGLPKTKVHALRHSCALRLARKDLLLARDVLGHASVGTTDLYLHDDRIRQQFATVSAIT